MAYYHFVIMVGGGLEAIWLLALHNRGVIKWVSPPHPLLVSPMTAPSASLITVEAHDTASPERKASSDIVHLSRVSVLSVRHEDTSAAAAATPSPLPRTSSSCTTHDDEPRADASAVPPLRA